MIDQIFACPVRKYHIDNQQDQIQWAESEYNNSKFDLPSPYYKAVSQVPEWVSKPYEEIAETFLKDLGIYETHVALITAFGLSVLDKNEGMDRCRTLPSHYTLTHYVSGKDPDVFYHPAQDLLSVVNPYLDEWATAKSLYINEGDVIIHPSYLEYSTPRVEKRRVTITLLFNIEEIPA
tara:strand:+ start:33 stop:566 length:534 start_codon:yes stop_codon:yes gene_type:complete